MPGTPDTPVSPAPGLDNMSRAFSVVGPDIVALWHSTRVNNQDQVFMARWPWSSPASAATNPTVQVTSAGTAATPHAWPASVLLPGDDLVLVYETGESDVAARTAASGALASAAEFPLTTTTFGVTARRPFAVLAGKYVIFFWHQQSLSSTTGFWQFRRWQHGGRSRGFDQPAQQLSSNAAMPPTVGAGGDFAAVADPSGHVWAAFPTADGTMRVIRLDPETTLVEEQPVSKGQKVPPSQPARLNDHPFLLTDGSDAVWVFWRARTGPKAAIASLAYQRVAATTPWTVPAALPPAATGTRAANPAAVLDVDGALSLIWSQQAGNGVSSIFLQRYLKDAASWGIPRQLTSSPTDAFQLHAMVGPGGAVLLFWLSARVGSSDLFSRQLFTVI
jgi:hypothetical protein